MYLVVISLSDKIFYMFQIFKKANKCLTCLSFRLGNDDYFFGNEPTSLDAFVYGCLAPLLKAPFPSSVFQNHLKANTNLVKFIDRITRRYFMKELKRTYVEWDAPTAQLHDFLSETCYIGFCRVRRYKIARCRRYSAEIVQTNISRFVRVDFHVDFRNFQGSFFRKLTKNCFSCDNELLVIEWFFAESRRRSTG